MSSHAILSASGSHRWLNCTPSARLELEFESQTSEAAKEGTAAHALCEHKLKKALKKRSRRPVSDYNSDEMEECTDSYAEYVMEQYEEAKKSCKDPIILIEQRLDFSCYVPDGFGTGDCIIISDDTLHIIDFKYGLGILVESEENPQMMLYALGALEIYDALYDIKTSQLARELNERDVPTKRNGKWTAHTIIGIIRNEKNTGDVIFQKTYTDDSFTRHVNRGEKDQFYAKDHHEALVSREDYAIANEMLDRNGLEKGITAADSKYQNRYVFTKRIICGECGSTWKRKKFDGYFGFNCSLHLKDKDACSMKSIREDKVKVAFITMMNKLTFGRDKVLKPYSAGLEEMEKAEYLDELNALEDAMEDNLQKRQQIKTLFSKGFIDPAVFAQENDSLVKGYEELTADRNAIIKQISGGDERKASLKELLHYTAKGQMLSEFDEELFIKFVDHIIVYERTEIGFAMKCGPVFRERID